MIRLRCLLLGTLTCSLLVPGSQGAVARDDQIERWVEELNAAEYDVRDKATQGLILAGPAAVEPVRQRLQNASLEVATRGIYILQELAMVGDSATELAARQVLRKVAEPGVSPAAKQASQALERLDDRRQDRALTELADLGADVIREYREFGESELSATRLAVEFGEKWHGVEKDLQRLQWLRDVEQINFVGPFVTDKWLQHLRQMQHVYFVKIARTQISDSAIRHLTDMPELRAVKLIYVPIGDAAVEHLMQCARVRTVFAYGTNMTATGSEQLRNRGVMVDLKKGAFLGIAVTSRNENWSIDRVTPGSAAEKGGILAGDVILRYGDQRVTDFKSLQDMIAKNVGGDTVRLHVLRRGQILQKEVTFGEWQ